MHSSFLKAAREHDWIPRVDVYRSPNGWLIKFDLAGVKKEDISVEARGSRLTVKGLRRDYLVSGNWSHYSMEIAYSHFKRTVELPCHFDEAELSAEFKDGMLLIYARPKGQKS